MARYSKTFAHIGRQKARASRLKQRHKRLKKSQAYHQRADRGGTTAGPATQQRTIHDRN